MKDKVQDVINKVKGATPDGVKRAAQQAQDNEHVKRGMASTPIKIGAAVALIFFGWLLFAPSSLIPPENVMRVLIAQEKEFEDRFNKLVLDDIEVEECEIVEDEERRRDVAECTVAITTTVYSPETNHIRHRPATKYTDTDTSRFIFFKDKNDKWKLDYAY